MLYLLTCPTLDAAYQLSAQAGATSVMELGSILCTVLAA